MTERRPHWDDDVITAVMSALPEQAKRVVGANDVFRIIAAVEDWARWEHVPKGTLLRLEQAEAVIARVRDVCDQADEDGTALVWLADVRRALDGSNSPPVTSEITGLLIDPDCRDGKHSSCVGGPCECTCHELAAP